MFRDNISLDDTTHFRDFLTFLVNSPYTTDGTFSKKISNMFKKLPKTGSSKHPWLTANAKLGTSFFGNLKNLAIFKFQNMGAPEHVSTPLVSKLKITFFPYTHTHEEEGKQAVWTVRTDVKGASRNNIMSQNSKFSLSRGYYFFTNPRKF